MDFAKKLMEKYGWKEGDGLGKNQSGICKPLKANLKFDTSGLGVDKAAEFNNHWWERVFNEAANNIDVVKTSENDIKLNVKDVNSVEISTKEYSVEKFKKHRRKDTYNNFFKSSTLTNLGTEDVEDKIQMSDIENIKFKQLTDEELFAACGGRTAHKGARHGLKLCGKLSRIEEQEKMLLERMQIASEKTKLLDKSMDEPNQDAVEEWVTIKSKKKKRSKIEKSPEVESANEISDILYNSNYCISSSKKKKKQKTLDNDLTTVIKAVSIAEDTAIDKADKLLAIGDNSRTIKKKNKKKKVENNDENQLQLYRDEPSQNDSSDCLEEASNGINVNLPILNEDNEKSAKKLKKNKKKLEKLKNKISKSESKKLSKKLKKTLGSVVNDLEKSTLIET